MAKQKTDILKLIFTDMETDAKEFEGKPFTGATVATYLGYQGAAISALANILREHLKEEEQCLKEKE